jgi:catechol 2,3-dioxygenase-like lactoylglutathione lyase family enzyme
MSRLRHIALSVPDPEKTAQFYEKALGMKRIGTLDHAQASGVYLSDGVINMAVLRYKLDEVVYKEGGKDYVGLQHFGFWVDDLEETREQIETNGGRYLTGAPPPESERSNRFYEVKFFDPNGIVIDITENGWGGALKDVTETPERETAA